MAYLVVSMYDEKSSMCNLVQVDDSDFNVKSNYGLVPLAELGRRTLQLGIKPLNYGVDRNGVVDMCCGKFSRFKSENSGVVLAKICSKSGRCIGFRVLSSSSLAVVNLKEDMILAKEKELGRPFLQNAIVRGGAVRCYPLHEYPVITIDKTRETRIKPVAPVVEELAPTKSAKAEVKDSANINEFTAAQIAELNMCAQAGIDSHIIRNPKLSPEQMRVLWASAKNGAAVKAFNKPEYSVDAMKFYADRLLTKDMVLECKEMLKHPELDTETLGELYLCVCDGVPYTDLIGKSSSEIEVEREMRSRKFWGDISTEFTGYDKAMKVALASRGF